MAFSIFNNIGFFFFFCDNKACLSWQHQFYFGDDIEETLYEVVFFMAKVSNMDKETNFASIFYSYCQNRSSDHKKYA